MSETLDHQQDSTRLRADLADGQLSEQFYPDGSLALRQYYEKGIQKGETARWLPDGRVIDASGKPQSRMSKWTERL